MVRRTSLYRSSAGALLLASAYFAAASGAVALTRFGGGVACLWVATAVLTAGLDATRTRLWTGRLLACWFAALCTAGAVGIGWRLGPLIATVNVAEGLIAATLIRRWRIGHSALDSLAGLCRFIFAACLIPSLAMAPFAAGIVGHASGTPFLENVINWTIGHVLGALTFTPVLSMIARGGLRRWWRGTDASEIGFSAALLGLIAATACLVFAQSRMPLLFLPALPLMLATFRLGRVGSAMGVIVVAVIGGAFTIRGLGPVTLMAGTTLARVQFFQFYLAVTLLNVLPVAADLNRRVNLYAQLRDSEARFRMIMEHSNDIVLSLKRDGSVRYISPSLERQIRHDPAAFRRRGLAELLAPADLRRLEQAHRDAIAEPGHAFSVEFAPPAETGEDRWFEANLRAAGGGEGTVGTIREITQRRLREAALARAADTDPLTGLANRRVFDERLSRALLTGAGGCVAIIDLDHFKRVNDQHGHAAGDEVLRVFARRAAGQLKAGDLLARIGGEEFGVVLAGASAEQARAACLRIGRALRVEPVAVEGAAIRITASAGLAAMGQARDPAHLVRIADEALYRAKREGRDRVVAAGDPACERQVA